jgi:hypothetical protein
VGIGNHFRAQPAPFHLPHLTKSVALSPIESVLYQGGYWPFGAAWDGSWACCAPPPQPKFAGAAPRGPHFIHFLPTDLQYSIIRRCTRPNRVGAVFRGVSASRGSLGWLLGLLYPPPRSPILLARRCGPHFIHFCLLIYSTASSEGAFAPIQLGLYSGGYRPLGVAWDGSWACCAPPNSPILLARRRCEGNCTIMPTSTYWRHPRAYPSQFTVAVFRGV